MPEVISATGKIKFSFEYYDTVRPDYCISCWEDDKIKKALVRLKEVNAKSFNELRQDRRVYHFGEVDWSKTTEKSGFNNRILVNLPPFHFSLLGVNGQLARVYGAYSAGTFYIVWFDLEHKIWPSPLKNT
jgi:hypothetical protein